MLGGYLYTTLHFWVDRDDMYLQTNIFHAKRQHMVAEMVALVVVVLASYIMLIRYIYILHSVVYGLQMGGAGLTAFRWRRLRMDDMCRYTLAVYGT